MEPKELYKQEIIKDLVLDNIQRLCMREVDIVEDSFGNERLRLNLNVQRELIDIFKLCDREFYMKLYSKADTERQAALYAKDMVGKLDNE